MKRYKEIDDNIIQILNDGKDHNLKGIVIGLRKIYDNFSKSTAWDHLDKLCKKKEIYYTKGDINGWKPIVFHKEERK